MMNEKMLHSAAQVMADFMHTYDLMGADAEDSNYWLGKVGGCADMLGAMFGGDWWVSGDVETGIYEVYDEVGGWRVIVEL